jgi:N-acetylmuramoyl-L-alanine amidase
MRRIRIALFLILSIFFSAVSAQLNSDSLIYFYRSKMKKYLDKDDTASELFLFTEYGIDIYTPATDTTLKKLENRIAWADVESYKNKLAKQTRLSSNKMLSDSSKDVVINSRGLEKNNFDNTLSFYKIALDPGHIAGDMEVAKKEKKYVTMQSPSVQLIEGELTLATTLILKKKLEKEGATVMLTRDKPNQSTFGVDYKKWKDSLFVTALDSAFLGGDISFEEKNYLRTKASDTEIFRRFFSLADVHQRAKKINAFHPDLTLVIHYNVDEANTNWNKPSKKNFNMAFVGGSFAANELDKSEARVEFLRLLLTDDIEKSIVFSKYIIESLAKKTKVPSALDSNATYLKDNCIRTNAMGVYCRNLTLTRKINGIVCYGESLYQDNLNECKALSKKEINIDGIETSKRVEEVAEAYFEGIINYVKRKTK